MRTTLVALVLLLAACGSTAGSSTTTAPPEEAPTSTTSAPSTPLLPSATATTPLDVAAVYLAVVEEAVDGTDLADFVDEEPESVLAIGQLFCELRDSGLSDEEALEVYLEGVASQRDLSEDDAVFAGVVFGAAERTLCPTTE
ncbi:MAG: hypothetical protein HKN46_03160 [Acidimicrobiia bacterium]|nr:hypothetical protein [Acidimicrobiia bacterium]